MTSSTRSPDITALPLRQRDTASGLAAQLHPARSGVAALVLGFVPYRHVSIPQRPRLPAGSIAPLL